MRRRAARRPTTVLPKGRGAVAMERGTTLSATAWPIYIASARPAAAAAASRGRCAASR